MSILRDRVIVGAIAGMAAIIMRDIYSIIAFALGFSKFQIWWLAAGLFMDDLDVVQGFGGVLIGIPADLVMGSFLGVAYIHYLTATKDQTPVLKGLGTGLGAWLLFYGLFWHNMPFIPTEILAPNDVSSNLSAAIGHSIFGISLGIFAWLLLRWQGLVKTENSRKGRDGKGEASNHSESSVDENDSDKPGIGAPKAPSAP